MMELRLSVFFSTDDHLRGGTGNEGRYIIVVQSMIISILPLGGFPTILYPEGLLLLIYSIYLE